ncbi:MFS transporter [Rhizobium sp. TRM96647]|uniref:MFS transporter n=1 Tax=unclassified Rhizobium TaxID=2613769 RepID=UPI0021E81966|nr:MULTISPECIES: MFS transporter [unclassified Rhizobium]MCV3738065.1 MFS transporter [Rhizobium sp. TRM96647]MCV3759752.1 MFS transporter [Rhizobium sp. TRM96650]
MFRAVAILSVTQIIAWATMFMAVSVLGDAIATDLGLTAAEVFLGPSAMLVAMAFASPATAFLYRRVDPRMVLVAGSLAALPGFALLATAQSPAVYYAGWVVLGIAGAGALTNAAHVYLSQAFSVAARRAIGAQMLAMALAPTVSWPAAAFLQQAFGWRVTFVLFAGAMLLVVVPLTLFGLRPVRPAISERDVDTGRRSATGGRYWLVMGLIVGAIALNGFVTWGFQLVVIALFRDLSVPTALAVGFASAIGVVQMSARLIDFLGGNRWDGLTTGLVAAGLMPVSLAVLIAGSGAQWTIVAFLVLYGLSSGAMAVSRATMPLVFFEGADYATAIARVGLPLNLAFAAAPPLFSFMIDGFGSRAALLVALALSLGTLACLAALNAIRPKADRECIDREPRAP